MSLQFTGSTNVAFIMFHHDIMKRIPNRFSKNWLRLQAQLFPAADACLDWEYMITIEERMDNKKKFLSKGTKPILLAFVDKFGGNRRKSFSLFAANVLDDERLLLTSSLWVGSRLRLQKSRVAKASHPNCLHHPNQPTSYERTLEK